MFKADSELVRDHLYHTFHSDDYPIFLKKKKKSAKLGHLFQSVGTGAFSPKALLHFLGGCPILKGSKHSSPSAFPLASGHCPDRNANAQARKHKETDSS